GGAHDQTLFIGSAAGRAEKETDVQVKQPRDPAQILNRGRGHAALDLAEPADRTLKRGGAIDNGQAARLTQSPDVLSDPVHGLLLKDWWVVDQILDRISIVHHIN